MNLHRGLFFISLLTLLTIGVPTNSYCMMEDLSLYGEEVSEGAPPSIRPVHRNVKNWIRPLKVKPGTLRINEGKFTSFVPEDQPRKKVIKPKIKKSKGAVEIYFFDQDEDSRSESLEPRKSKMASEDTKFDTLKKRKTVDDVVVKRKEMPISTDIVSAPKRQKIAAPKTKSRLAVHKHKK